MRRRLQTIALAVALLAFALAAVQYRRAAALTGRRCRGTRSRSRSTTKPGSSTSTRPRPAPWVRQQIGDHVAVGGTYVQDDLDQGRYELAGVDAEIRVREGTRIVAEYADSSGADATVYVSRDGGITYQPVPLNGMEDGSAWKLAGEVDLGEWFGRPGRWRAGAYFKDLDAGFVSSGNFLDQGTRAAGVHADLKLGESDTVQIRHDREDRTSSPTLPASLANETQTTSAQWSHVRERWTLGAELLDRNSQGTAAGSNQDSTLAAARYWTKLTEKLSGSLEHQQTLSGQENDQTTLGVRYQAKESVALEAKATDGTLGSAAQVGAVVNVGDVNLYLTQRMAEDQAGRKNSTILGAKSPLGKNTKLDRACAPPQS